MLSMLPPEMETTITHCFGGTQLYFLVQGKEGDNNTCSLLRFCLKPNSNGIESVQYLNAMIKGFPMKKIIVTNEDEVHGFSFDDINGTINHAISRNCQKFTVVQEQSVSFSTVSGIVYHGEALNSFQTVMDNNNGCILMVRMQQNVIELYRFNKKEKTWNVSIIPKNGVYWGYLKYLQQPVSFSAGCILKGGIILFIDNISAYVYFIDPKSQTCRNSGWKVPSADDGAGIYKINIISDYNKDHLTIYGFIRPLVDAIGGTTSLFMGQIISNYYSNEYIHVIIDACGYSKYGEYYLRSWLYSVDTIFS